MGRKRRIAALWLPCWSIERLYRDLEYRMAPRPVLEKPRALGRPGPGGLRVTACDHAALAAGIVPGQLVPDAVALCPGLELHAADDEGERAALARLALWCGRYTPWTAMDPNGIGDAPDGILLDITGCDHLFGGEAALIAELRQRLKGFGLTARIAVASTPGAAWALARFGGEPVFVLAPEGEAEALRSFPVAALRLDDAIADGLNRLGRLDEALGFEAEPISPGLPHVPYRASLSFPESLIQTAHIEEAVKWIATDLCDVLQREQKGARRLELLLFRVDGEVKRLQAGTGLASHDATHLSRLFREKLDRTGDSLPVLPSIRCRPRRRVSAMKKPARKLSNTLWTG